MMSVDVTGFESPSLMKHWIPFSALTALEVGAQMGRLFVLTAVVILVLLPPPFRAAAAIQRPAPTFFRAADVAALRSSNLRVAACSEVAPHVYVNAQGDLDGFDVQVGGGLQRVLMAWRRCGESSCTGPGLDLSTGQRRTMT